MLKKLNLLWLQSNWHIIIQNLFLIFSIWFFIVILHIFAEQVTKIYIRIEQVEYIWLILIFFLFFWILFTWGSVYKFLSQLYKDSRIDFIETLLFILVFTIVDDKILIILLYILIFLISLYLVENLYKNKPKPSETKWLLLWDNPINTKEEDTLGFTEKVIDFIDIVHNNWSSEQFVYWLEAPWWHGKSTFLSIFKKIINKDNITNWIQDANKKIEIEEKTKNIKIFEFNPWHFNNDVDLLEKFFEEFKLFLTNEFFLPELNNNITQLTEKLDWLSDKFIWTKIFSNKKTLEDTKQSIRNSLNKIDDKILIIIDDLDRIPSKKLKTIFSLIDLVKSFPKVNFIVCYDSCNFNHIEDTLKDTVTTNEWNTTSISNEKINNNNLVEYISKIINVKYILLPSIKKIKSYFRNELLNNKFNFSESSKESIKNGIDNLFDKSLHVWWENIINIRAIKRIINILIIVQNFQKMKFTKIFDANYGLKFETFIKMSILSINYPKLYREIYNDTLVSSWIIYLSEDKNYKDDTLENYLKTLNSKEVQIIKDLIGYNKMKANKPNDPDGFDWPNLWFKSKIWLYIHLVESSKEIWKEIDINNMKDNIFTTPQDIYKNFKIISNLYQDNWVNQLINLINTNISQEKDSKKIAKNLFHFYISNEFKEINNWEILNTYDWIRLLNDGVWKHNSTENCKYIWNFLYWENVIENLVKSWEAPKLSLTIRIMNSLYDWDLYNFSRWMIDDFELNWNKNYYIAKISRVIFKNFRDTYIEKKINIFELEWFQRHILYYTSLYIWRFYDNEDELNDISNIPEVINKNFSKLLDGSYYQEFQDYIFNVCLNWAWKEEIFFNHFSLYIRSPDSYFNRNNNEVAFHFEWIESEYILHPYKTKEFISTNYESLKTYITQNKDKTFKIEDNESKTLWEIWMIILNYFTEKPKKENS